MSMEKKSKRKELLIKFFLWCLYETWKLILKLSFGPVNILKYNIVKQYVEPSHFLNRIFEVNCIFATGQFLTLIFFSCVTHYHTLNDTNFV